MNVTKGSRLQAHYRAIALSEARTHAEGWTRQYRSDVRFARENAGTKYWVAAWEHLERAVNVSGPYALEQWREYRAAKERLNP